MIKQEENLVIGDEQNKNIVFSQHKTKSEHLTSDQVILAIEYAYGKYQQKLLAETVEQHAETVEQDADPTKSKSQNLKISIANVTPTKSQSLSLLKKLRKKIDSNFA